MKGLTINQNSLKILAKKYSLRFVILHGSAARNTMHKDSDIDIAVVGDKPLSFKDQIKLFGDFEKAIHSKIPRDFDIKTLEKADPLFLNEVVSDGVLLYGNALDFEELKSYAFRAYMDSYDLRELELALAKKYQKHLNSLVSQMH
ncbi:MAG: nucleotidyltransferase domain-containing protein [Patescibacteria group bacterium]